ncbi:MAG: hypothetical protein JW779_06985 [Candidatus Thorarchaeota archaeon]|nr:hypothetical protein [Candidatus Thorarchaeota archaeon]
MNRTGSGPEKTEYISSRYQDSFHTSYDDLLPVVEEPAVQFYLDAMRIYLGLCEGSITMEAAINAVDILKQNPEYTSCPTNPIYIPINQRYKTKILENLKTLNKFNLFTKSAIRSAYNFVFLAEQAPINDSDLSVLMTLSKDPLISLVDASSILNLAPRTIARSIERLRERHQFRVSNLLDESAFNLQSVVLFFEVRDGIEWDSIENGFNHYPYVKSILKTTMTDIGYASFLIPNFNQNESLFVNSIKSLSKAVFEYSSLHKQMQMGAVANPELFDGESWTLPENLENMLIMDRAVNPENYPPLLSCSGTKPEFSKEDLAIAQHLKLDARTSPSKMSDSLNMGGWNIDSRKVSSVIRRMQQRNLILPYIIFTLPKLSSNFCFEITCNNDCRYRILETIAKFPWAMYYLSDRGIIVWTMVPGEHQVDYYQLFRALEQRPGINAVHPIMTISPKGSRSLINVLKNISYESGVWSLEPDILDITEYFEI